jgi:fatty-acyl-CoA synthase
VLGDMQPPDTLTATLPLFHVGGTVFLRPQQPSCRQWACSSCRPAGLRNPAMVPGLLALVAAIRRHARGAVPTSVGAVLDVPLDGADLAPCAPASAAPRRCRRRRASASAGHGRDLHEVYGMTEASGLIAIDPRRRAAARARSAGPCLHRGGVRRLEAERRPRRGRATPTRSA